MIGEKPRKEEEMRTEMMYSEAAAEYGLEPVEVFCPDEKDFEVYVEDGDLYSNADGSRGDMIASGVKSENVGTE